MKARLKNLEARIDAISLRERAIILLAALTVLYALFNALLLQPAANTQRQQMAQIQDLRSRLAGLAQEGRVLATGNDQSGPARRVADLRAQIQASDQRLATALGGVVKPAEAPQILKALVKRQAGLQLDSLKSDAGGPLLGAGADTIKVAAGEIARYDFTLHLRGSYLATLRYMERLEHLPWRLFWQGADFRITRHPEGKMTLELFTIGRTEGATATAPTSLPMGAGP